MCGEYTVMPIHPLGILGSPPHVWGIHIHASILCAVDRITPTCVGNTAPHTPHSCSAGDHPHMCGEYGFCKFSSLNHSGSPPHVWGILCTCTLCIDFFRITPHMCGEYCFMVWLKYLIMGSPPHVWGILMVLVLVISAQRITPTCVGNTFLVDEVLPGDRDHPHMCGEYTKRSQYWCHS